MELKDLAALFLMAVAISGGVVATCLSQRARAAAFFLLILASAFTDRVDVNFVTRYWYRAATRGFEISLVDILAISLLISSLLLPRPGHRRWFWPASLGAMIIYFLYCCFSVAISEPKLFGLFELSKILRGILVFLAAAVYVQTERELRLLVLALGCAICFQGVLALKHRYVNGVYRVTGSLLDPNSLSMYLCTTAPVFFAAAASNFPKYLRKFCLLCSGITAVTILLTISRAGIPIFALVALGATMACASFRITFKKTAAVFLVCLALGGMVYKSWDTLKVRYGQASLKEEYLGEQFENRGSYLRQAWAILQDRFFGVGLNNWSYWVSEVYGPQLGIFYEAYPNTSDAPSKDAVGSFTFAPPAHSLMALTAGELGWPGLMIFLLVWLRWFQMGASFLRPRSPEAMHRLGVGFFFSTCGIFLQSQTEWTYRQTHIFYTFNVLLGALASLYYVKGQAARTPIDTNALTEEFSGNVPSAEPPLACR